MVGNEVRNDFHPGRMRPIHKSIEFRHAFFRAVGKVRVDIVVVAYGIGRSGIALDETLPAGMPRDACVPDDIDGKASKMGQEDIIQG